MQKKVFVISSFSVALVLAFVLPAYADSYITLPLLKGNTKTDFFNLQDSNGTTLFRIFTNGTVKVVAGQNIITGKSFIIPNPTNTYAYTLNGGAITANKTINLPTITGTDTIATLGLGQTFTGNDIFNSLTLGGAENANSNQINNLAVPTHSTDTQISNHLGLLGSMVMGTCSNGQALTYQSSNGTWVCNNVITSALTSINGQNGPTISIVRQPGNTTISNSSNTITIGFGPNVVITGGASQEITKQLKLDSAVLGGQLNLNGQTMQSNGHVYTYPSNTGTITLQNGTFSGTISSASLGNALNANNNRITNVGTPSSSTDATPANKEGVLGNKVIGTCANGQVLQYQSSNSTWICANQSGGITSINSQTGPSITLSGTTNDISVSQNSNTVTFDTGSNIPKLIGTFTLNSAASSLDTGTITAYNHYMIYLSYYHNDATAFNGYMRFNGDSANDYTNEVYHNGGSNILDSGVSRCDLEDGNLGSSNAQATGTVFISNVSGKFKNAYSWVGIALSSTLGIDDTKNDCNWSTTTGQITDITLVTTNSAQFAPGTTMTIYGYN